LKNTAMNKISKQTTSTEGKITRKEALQKAGKYAAFTAATMMVLLSTPNKAAASPANPAPPSEW
jgi:formiminotetrahydrofolate cyclodeaminase